MTRSKAFEVLGLDSNATTEEIKTAYAELSKKYHPEENPKAFQEIHEAYVTLVHRKKNHLHMTKVIVFDAQTQSEKPMYEQEEDSNSYDFSDVDNAKQRDFERKLQSAIQELESMTYADKNYDIYINNHRLEKFFRAQDAEVLYSEELVEKLITLLQQALVNGETVRIVNGIIRPWDKGLENKRELLNRLKKVLQERNRYYYIRHISAEDKDIVPYICWGVIGVLLVIGIITNFILIIKCLVAFLLVGVILLLSYKTCRKIASERGSAVISCFVVWGFMVLGYFCEIWTMFPEIPEGKALYGKFIELWIIVIAGTAFRMTRGNNDTK